jgi:membrane fusion protein (multidrug efflux system)
MEARMEETKVTSNQKRKKIALLVFIAIALIGAIILFFYLRYKATHISTDDAFVDGHIHTIASKVAGTVKAIYVKDNQSVKEGDLLLEIDPVDYEVKVKEASSGLSAENARLSELEAKIEASKKQLSESHTAMEVARANLELQEANLKQAEIDIKRAENLYKKDAISKEKYEKTMTAYNDSV